MVIRAQPLRNLQIWAWLSYIESINTGFRVPYGGSMSCVIMFRPTVLAPTIYLVTKPSLVEPQDLVREGELVEELGG